MKSYILIFALLFSASFFAQDISYLEYLRTDLQKQKRDIIGETMGLSDDEANIFWPIYSKYESELDQINGEKLSLIKDYAQNYYKLSDELAVHLANKKHELDTNRSELLWSYYNKLESKLNPINAAMFYQLESQLLMLIDVQVAGEIPIIKKPKSN
ncbi:MAG: hypothetical protein P8X73_10410 [Ignavibacteriaceae bacterium]